VTALTAAERAQVSAESVDAVRGLPPLQLPILVLIAQVQA
jgi:hypothetical protein